MAEIRCHVCGEGPQDGITVYRQNEKGMPAIWACVLHRKAPVDPGTQEIVDILEEKD